MISQKTAPEFAQADQLTQSERLFAARAAQPRPAPLRARNEPAYVLAAWPWKETSLIAEILTPHYGRVSVTVRGAKRPGTKFRGLINAFVPLVVNFSGAGEVKNLTDAKWLGGLAPIAPQSLVSAFYVTELVLKLTVREDPSQELFAAYAKVSDAKSLASVIGEDELSDVDKKYMLFGNLFEEHFIAQGADVIPPWAGDLSRQAESFS